MQPGLTLSRRLTSEDGARFAVFGVVGVASIQAWPAAPATLPPPGDFSDAMLLAIFAFTGFEAALVDVRGGRGGRHGVSFPKDRGPMLGPRTRPV